MEIAGTICAIIQYDGYEHLGVKEAPGQTGMLNADHAKYNGLHVYVCYEIYTRFCCALFCLWFI